MEESAGVIEAFSLRWFSLCLFLTVLHSVYCVVVMLLKSCFSGAEIYFLSLFQTIESVDIWYENNCLMTNQLSLPGYAGRSGIQMNSCYLSTTLLGRNCGKIFGTFKATHWSPEFSYFNKHFPGWKFVLCYELIISSDRNLWSETAGTISQRLFSAEMNRNQVIVSS